ncbi:TorF family putative porin [Acinetobacter portensis]|uniref:TorF family putative porin n=1 Tax=Acinetobacter portensis TaxID=1839785 RepID=UPI0013CF6985|nr:TorF family putative porin [Acinetobacter portensis]
MKFTLKALSLALVTSVSTVAFADEAPALPFGLEFSGSAAMTTDYRFRGMSQTENDPAVQVGFQLDHASGLYAGVWGSNVYIANGDAGVAHLELDPYLGYAKTFEGVAGKPTLDVGVYYYAYPGNSDLNFVEYYAGVGFEGLITEGDSLSTSVNYTNDYLGLDIDAWYLGLGYTIPFADTGFSGIANIGYTTTDKYYFDAASKDDSYWDWKAGVAYEFKSIEGFSAELAAVGTNIETKNTASTYKRGVETGAVFTLTKSF